jgi:hypothetical protein
VAGFDPDRLQRLFRERQSLAQAAQQAGREANDLVAQHNALIMAAEKAPSPSARLREQARAHQKYREADAARIEHERRTRDLLRKETEIVDLIAAMVAAAETLLTADQGRRIAEDVAAIRERLGRIDGYLRRLGPALADVQAAVNGQAELLRSMDRGPADIQPALTALGAALDQEAAAVEKIRKLAQAAANELQHLHREQRHQADALGGLATTLARRMPGGEPVLPIAIVQEGWSPHAPDVAEPRAADLPAAQVAALPERTIVLLFASEPVDEDPVDLNEEIRQIHMRIDEAVFGSHIDLRAWVATRPLDLLPNFNRHQPHMVQFSGHGHADGVLLTGPRGRAEPMATDRLVQMFRWSCQQLRIVFFNVCDSVEHATAAARLVDAAIGMDGRMHDVPARTFAAALYSALAYGCSLKKAFHQACAAIGNHPDALVPQIFFRDGVDPHKVLLVRPPDLQAR